MIGAQQSREIINVNQWLVALQKGPSSIKAVQLQLPDTHVSNILLCHVLFLISDGLQSQCKKKHEADKQDLKTVY